MGSGGQWARGAEWGNTRRGPILPRLLTHPFRIPAPSTLSQFIPSFAEHFFSPSHLSFPFGHAQRLPSLPLCRTVSRACLRGVAASTAHDQRTIPTPPSLLPPAQPNLTPFGVVRCSIHLVQCPSTHSLIPLRAVSTLNMFEEIATVITNLKVRWHYHCRCFLYRCPHPALHSQPPSCINVPFPPTTQRRPFPPHRVQLSN